jgi:hypothetical protein
MDAICSLWRSWSLEQRRKALSLDHAETIRSLDEQVRRLWAAEMQLRNALQSSTAPPLAKRLSTHSLLTTMHFDGKGFFIAASLSSALGGKEHRLVQWYLYEKPDSLLDAFSQILSRSGITFLQQKPKPMKMTLWPKLLQPAAQSWAELELSLAQVILQMILSAEACLETEAIALPRGDHAPSANDSWMDEASEPIAQQSKRQARKASQQERRAAYREAKRAARGVEPSITTNSSNHKELECGSSRSSEQDECTEPCSCHRVEDEGVDQNLDASCESCEQQYQASSSDTNAPISSDDEITEDRSSFGDCDNGQDLLDAIALQQEVQHLVVELQSRENTNPRSAAAAALQHVGPSVFPTVLRMALDAIGAEKTDFDDLRQIPSKNKGDLLASEVSSGGQGRPLERKKIDAVAAMPCIGAGCGRMPTTPSTIGAGRGRILTPPGRIESKPLPPDGLSRWRDACLLKDYSIITEETEDDFEFSRLSEILDTADATDIPSEVDCHTNVPDFQLPPPVLAQSSLQGQGSAMQSPLMGYWARTPSSPGTPRNEFMSYDDFMQRPSIPQYVTVPLSDARCCPNCGMCFAIPTGMQETALLGPSH